MELGVGLSLIILVVVFIRFVVGEVRAFNTPRGREEAAARQRRQKQIENEYGIIKSDKK